MEIKECPQCKSKIPIDWKECPFCGYQIGDVVKEEIEETIESVKMIKQHKRGEFIKSESMDGIKICPRCGSEILQDVEHCPFCEFRDGDEIEDIEEGVEVVDECIEDIVEEVVEEIFKTCPRCKSEISQQLEICPFCGYKDGDSLIEETLEDVEDGGIEQAMHTENGDYGYEKDVINNQEKVEEVEIQKDSIVLENVVEDEKNDTRNIQIDSIEKIICPACGERIPKDSESCPLCGNPLN